MRRLLIAVVVLGLIAVAGDRVAENIAEGQIASAVRDNQHLPSEPSVEFAGFPFLTQVLGNDVQEVKLTMPAVDAEAGDTERVRVKDVSATFYDVSTSHQFRQATAKRMTGSALIPFGSVSALGPFTASYGGTSPDGVGLVTLEPDVSALDVSFDVGVSIEARAFSFVGRDGTTGVLPVPDNLRPLLEPLLLPSHDLYGLPPSFTIESLQVTKQGITLKLSGRDVELAR
ncbi:MAG: DUF2993 domain-containing protein [Nocardioidaceae bacterium]